MNGINTNVLMVCEPVVIMKNFNMGGGSTCNILKGRGILLWLKELKVFLQWQNVATLGLLYLMLVSL